jgi:hypothetical protein
MNELKMVAVPEVSDIKLKGIPRQMLAAMIGRA